uniref:Uncharacterized protein n=1 Tax=Panagrolaimus davidi TaxID=227884 RepID=A0A914QRF3_9BILA
MLTFLGAASSSIFRGKCWRQLTKYKNANLLVVQIAPNAFMELSIDDGRTNARCTNEACKPLNVLYRVKDKRVVDDPRLRHHDLCPKEIKTADEIRRQQFCREFLLKISARSVPPEFHEFENMFKAAFGEACFTEIYGTPKEQKKFQNRIYTAYNSKVEREKMEQILKEIDDFNPDDLNDEANIIGREEDEEETESTDAQLNE